MTFRPDPKIPDLTQAYSVDDATRPEFKNTAPEFSTIPASTPPIGGSPSPTQKSPYSKIGLVLLAATAVIIAIVVGFSFLSSGSSGDKSPVEDAPVIADNSQRATSAPEPNTPNPSVPEKKDESTAPAEPITPTEITYELEGVYKDSTKKPGKVTIIFYNSFGEKQTVSQTPSPSAGSFTWNNTIVNKISKDAPAAVKVTADSNTRLTCKVTKAGKVLSKRVASKEVNCGFTD